MLKTFPKLQQDSCKYYRSIDLFRNKILSVALLGGTANRGKGRRKDGNVSTDEIAVQRTGRIRSKSRDATNCTFTCTTNRNIAVTGKRGICGGADWRA